MNVNGEPTNLLDAFDDADETELPAPPPPAFGPKPPGKKKPSKRPSHIAYRISHIAHRISHIAYRISHNKKILYMSWFLQTGKSSTPRWMKEIKDAQTKVTHDIPKSTFRRLVSHYITYTFIIQNRFTRLVNKNYITKHGTILHPSGQGDSAEGAAARHFPDDRQRMRRHPDGK